MSRLRGFVEYLRAGALAAGVAFLLGVWFQGMHRLGFRGSYPDGLPDFLMVALAGTAFAAWFGFREPAGRAVVQVARVAGTFVAGVVVGGALAGASVLLVKLEVREASLPFYFVPVGAILVAVGLRRLPRTLPGRLALGVPVALLLIMRLLAIWPPAAHRITRALFPLRQEVVRAEVDRLGWGQPTIWDRSRIVELQSTPTYGTDFSHLSAEVELRMTLEVTKPYWEDHCGAAHGDEPQPPEWVRSYQTIAACHKEHPRPQYRGFERPEYRPDPCCLVQVKPRVPGERLRPRQIWRFVFHHFKWQTDS